MKRKPRKWDVPWDPRIESKFKDLIKKSDFRRIVEIFRSRAGIPMRGIDIKNEPFEKYFSSANKEGQERLRLLRENVGKTLKQFHLEKKIFEVPVREYLCSGMVLISPFRGLYSDLVFGKGTTSIVIRPGATERMIKNEIHRWWVFIESRLKMMDPRAKRFRGRSNRERIKNLSELFGQKVIRKDGYIRQSAARGYFHRENPDDEITEEDFRAVGMDIPKTPEARRKIISRILRKDGI